jgi:hypothetical protein
MSLLSTQAEIRAAIAMMDNTARIAAQSLANYILENMETLGDEEALSNAYSGACVFAMEQDGWDMEDEERIEQFSKLHGNAVQVVALSIVQFVISQQKRKRKWGWVGKAAAFVGGVAVASFFG